MKPCLPRMSKGAPPPPPCAEGHKLTALSAAVGSELVQTAGGTETAASARAGAEQPEWGEAATRA